MRFNQAEGTQLLRRVLLLLLLLSALTLAHPMDEWFAHIEADSGQGVTGVLRVPTDQVENLSSKPLLFDINGSRAEPAWTNLGEDADGRTKLELKIASSEVIGELTIGVPQGLLDENQTLVGFVKFDESEPSTIMIEPGAEVRLLSSGISVRATSATEFVKLGLTHIVEGYDHLLFLFCLLIAGGTLRHFLVVVTSFTLGHSVTLALSVLGYISLPSHITESIIALSIVIAALLNIPWLKESESSESTGSIKSRGLLAGGFGLIHGLGFAGILKEIGVQGSGVAAPLLGFNVGVELGQLVLVAIFYPVLMAVNKWRHRVPCLIACSCIAAIIGAYWVVERVGLLG